MIDETIRSSENEKARVEARGGRRQTEDIELIELGRASEHTRGSYSGFVVEPSAFPLRDF